MYCIFTHKGTRTWRNQVRYALEEDEANRPRRSKKQRVASYIQRFTIKGFQWRRDSANAEDMVEVKAIQRRSACKGVGHGFFFQPHRRRVHTCV